MSEKIDVQKMNDTNKAKRLDRLNAKKSALSTIIEAVKKSGDSDALKALDLLTASKGRQSGSGKLSAFFNALKTEKSITEIDVFNRFKMGRGDCRKATRYAVKNLAPSERLYIIFDDVNECYNLAGQGEKPPVNYSGFLPTKGLERYNDGPYGHK